MAFKIPMLTLTERQLLEIKYARRKGGDGSETSFIKLFGVLLKFVGVILIG